METNNIKREFIEYYILSQVMKNAEPIKTDTGKQAIVFFEKSVEGIVIDRREWEYLTKILQENPYYAEHTQDFDDLDIH